MYRYCEIRYRIIVFLLVLICFQTSFHAQELAKQWLFNSFSLEFINDSAIAVPNDFSDFRSNGYASICDTNGQLVLYSNGFKALTPDNELIENGDSLLIPGTEGTSNISSLIIPSPGNAHRYFIFTLSPYNGNPAAGLYYAEADMSANNGKGLIIQKRIRLTDSTTNKITALYHANRHDVWVITHRVTTNSYYAFIVNNEGVSLTPVISILGKPNSSSFEGQMKGSPDGTKIAVSYDTWHTGEGFDLFDFNNETGVLSNSKSFVLPDRGCHGLEFSPDATRLYVYQYGSTGESGLYQFTLIKNNQDSINASRRLVLQDQINGFESMQIGPNGVIYIAKGGGGYDGALYFGTIRKPDEYGLACEAVEKGLYLNGGFGGSVLFPNFIQDYFFKTDVIVKGYCFGDSTAFSITNTYRIDSVLWDFGDNVFSRKWSPKHKYKNAGSFTPRLIVHYIDKTDTVYKSITVNPVPLVSLGNDTTVCSGYKVQLTDKYENITWPDNSHLRYFYPHASGKLGVTVQNKFKCLNSDTVNLVVKQSPHVNLGNDTVICNNVNIILQTGTQPEGTTFLWSNGSTGSSLQVKQEGTYWLKATNALNCSTTDFIDVAHKPAPVVNLGSDTTVNGFAWISLSPGYFGYPTEYLWNDNSNDQSKFYNARIHTPGTDTIFVRVTASNKCTSADTILITLVQDFIYNNACEGIDTYFSLGTIQSVDSVIWVFGDQAKGNGFFPSHKYIAGEYLVKSIAFSNGEPDTVMKRIYIEKRPVVNLGEDLTISSNSILTLYGGKYEMPVMYRWDNYESAPYRTIEVKYLYPGVAHDFYLTVITLRNHCIGSDTITITLDDATASKSTDLSDPIQLFPNPARDIVYIDILQYSLRATLFDASGRASAIWDLKGGRNEINISAYKAGFYTIIFSDDEGFTKIVKLIKL